MTVLYPKMLVRDGGSVTYTDSEGNEYYRYRAFADKDKDIYNKLFIGDINNRKERVLAKGSFKLMPTSMQISRNLTIIEQ